jgi:lipopolysaccharide biosynthesis protein
MTAEDPLRPRGQADSDRLAVVVHAFYPDVFRDILAGMRGLEVPHKVFVTTTPCQENAIRELLDEMGVEHEMIVCENRGRDVAPFLTVLPEVVAQGFAYVLKVHTKRSPHRADGDQWRKEMYDCLATPAQIAWILDAMRARPRIGMVGPIDHVVPMTTNWELNQTRVRSLAFRMSHLEVDLSRDKFIAGTMFMARTEALAPAIRLGLRRDDFEDESGQVDGTLAHALERAFSYGVRAAGFELAAAPVSTSAQDRELTVIDDAFKCTGRLHAPGRRSWFRALLRAPGALSRRLNPASRQASAG